MVGLFSLLGAQDAQGAPLLTFSVSRASFDTVAVFDSAEQVVEVVNAGDETLTVTDILSADSVSAFSATPTSFSVGVGDSQSVTLTFAPAWGGSHVDALLFSTDGEVPGGGLSALLAEGTAQGPGLQAQTAELSFESLELGVAKVASVILTNTGNATLTVSDVLADDARFSVATTQLTLAPSAASTVEVTYTPTGSSPVSDSLRIESDDPGAPVVALSLKTEETPVNAANARVALALVEGSTTPVVGDTLSIHLTLSANGDTLSGAEVFLRYDATALVPADPVVPAQGAGFTQGLEFLINRIEGSGTEGVVHFSAAFNKSKTTTDTLATVTFVVENPLEDVRTIRLLTDAPLLNSQFSRPDGLSRTLPGVNRIQIGNAPPQISPFPIVGADEDDSGSIGLNGLVVDLETSDADLTWSFDDIDGLGLVSSVSTPSPQTGQVGRIFPPADGFGVFRIQATVVDASGAADSVVALLDVTPMNDPPSELVYSAPADSSRDLGTPIEFRWVGSDPEGDTLTYEFRFGPDSDNLIVSGAGLTAPEFVVVQPSPGATLFWQVVARDSDGLTRDGPIYELTFAEDQTPPAFMAEPVVGTITSISVRIVWQTTEVADARVRLGTLPDLSDSTSFEEVVDDGHALTQDILIDGLDATFTYYYRVVIADVFGNRYAGDVGTFTTADVNAGDLDGDGEVGFQDTLQFAASFGLSASDADFDPRADLTGDGVVNFTDFLSFANLFGTVYPSD